MNISQLLNRSSSYLMERRIESGRIDAEVLLGECTGKDRAGLYRDGHQDITPDREKRFWEFVERRVTGEPLAYLIGRKEFMGLDFEVNPTVLIPRPETELMVEKALEIVQQGAVVVDVGTGSGAIAVSLAMAVKTTFVYALDISPGALVVAGRNARRHGVEDRVKLIEGDLLQPLQGVSGFSAHLITANLPYIPSADIPLLMPGVRDYEPRQALDGGEDGLDLYRRLTPQASDLLTAGGHLLMEIAPGQKAAMKRILTRGWRWEVLSDLAGRERLVIAKKMSFGCQE